MKEQLNIGSVCPVYKKCSGCQLMNMTYEEQLRFKQVKINRLMGRLCRPDRIIGMESPEGYRCKVQGAFDFKNGKAVSGIYQSASGGVVPVDRCIADDERADRIIKEIRKTALSLKISFRCSYTGKGFLRHASVRIGKRTGEIMVTVVGAEDSFPSKDAFVKRLTEKCPEITTLIFAVNKSDKMFTGSFREVLHGKGYIDDILCGKRFRISPMSFAQVNPVQAEKLYELAVGYASLTGKETVVDAFCGTGTMSIIAADKAEKVYGCEINREAVKDAVINAEQNGADNTEFVCADSGDFMERFNSEGLKADAVILDPARAGSGRKFLQALAEAAPERIVYVSCAPETMARDVFFLIKNGYRMKKLTPVDMFPFTGHVECVALLSKLKSDKHIDIELKTDELDLTSAESKATYNEIKAYVREHTGLTVSSLNIAQTKQKCGITERDNYNKPKSDKYGQPKCTKEKEAAIIEAFRHFNMI